MHSTPASTRASLPSDPFPPAPPPLPTPPDKDTTKESGGGSIPRADVAAVCVEALTNPKAGGAKFSIYTTKGGRPEGDYDAYISSLFG